jgi:hypothetical protein
MEKQGEDFWRWELAPKIIWRFMMKGPWAFRTRNQSLTCASTVLQRIFTIHEGPSTIIAYIYIVYIIWIRFD